MKSHDSIRPSVIGKATEKSTHPRRAAIGLGIAAVVLWGGMTANARADDADLAKSKKCMNCHALDEKRVGPPFKAVAARYANDQAAEERLADKIRNGGSGAWGVVPMPQNDEVSKEDAKRLAHWVLMQK